MDFSALLTRLLATIEAQAPLASSLEQWHQQALACWTPDTTSGARALLAGVIADRLGFAFAGGYSAALQRLLNDASPRLAAFCVTEAEGNQPRHIHTRLTPTGTGWQLDGEKTFVTLADRAEWLWIAASTGEQDGRKQIRLVGIPSQLHGVELIPLPTMRFVPEIGHARVRFHQVQIPAGAVLPGDGYSDHVKPFRTIEDIHVCAATCGLLLGQAVRQQWLPAIAETLLSLAYGWWKLAQEPAQAPATHLALAGLMTEQTQLIEAVTPFLSDTTEFAEHWRRDQPLLKVAEKARQQRTANAWQHMLAANRNHDA